MSITYELEIDTDRDPEDLIARLARQPGFRSCNVDETGEAGGSIALGPGLRIVAIVPEQEDALLTQDLLGFTPTVSIIFIETGRDVADDIRYPAMITAVVAVMAEIAGDAVLSFDDSIVLFLRRSGRVTINTDWDEGQWAAAAPGAACCAAACRWPAPGRWHACERPGRFRLRYDVPGQPAVCGSAGAAPR